MKHARDDYARIQDPAELIPEDEPVFLLRGQDMAAPATVFFWANQVIKAGGDPEIVAAARSQACEMQRWQQAHGSKAPDLPKDYGDRFEPPPMPDDY